MRQRVRGSFLWTATSTLRAASLCAEDGWWMLAEAMVAKPERVTAMRVERMLGVGESGLHSVNEGGVRPRSEGECAEVM